MRRHSALAGTLVLTTLLLFVCATTGWCQLEREPSTGYVDTSRLRQIEQAALPLPLVEGPNAHDDLPAYYLAANQALGARLEAVRHSFQCTPRNPFHGLTLVAGGAGVGKSFLQGHVFPDRDEIQTVCKFDLRELYEEWQKEGTVEWKPDLCDGDVVINQLLSVRDPGSQPLLQFLNSTSASFYVIDSLDELHPDDYQPVLEQIETFARSEERPFVHVVVFGRPLALRKYWQQKQRQGIDPHVALFTLNPPALRTTGDLLVSSWQYDAFKHKDKWILPEGGSRPVTLAEYTEWERAGFSHAGQFANISYETNQEMLPNARCSLLECASRYPAVSATLGNLAGNGIMRSIIADRAGRGLPYDERAVTNAYLDAWLQRGHKSHNRPDASHPIHLDLYLQLLEGIAVRYLVDDRVDEQGYFVVDDGTAIEVDFRGQRHSFPVQQVLDRSGLKHLEPGDRDVARYRFEPVWLHRLLVERHNERVSGHVRLVASPQS